MPKLTHEYLAAAKLPLIAYDTDYTWGGPNNERLVAGKIEEIVITRYDVMPGASSPTIQYHLRGHLPVASWRTSATRFYQDRESAQTEIDEAMKQAKERPCYEDLLEQRNACRDLLVRLKDAVDELDGTTVENEKLVDDYRALMAKIQGDGQ